MGLAHHILHYLGIYLTGTERDWSHDKGTGTWKSWGRVDGVHWWSIILKLTEFIIAIKMGGGAIVCGWTGRQGWLNPSEQGLTNHSQNILPGSCFQSVKITGEKATEDVFFTEFQCSNWNWNKALPSLWALLGGVFATLMGLSHWSLVWSYWCQTIHFHSGLHWLPSTAYITHL